MENHITETSLAKWSVKDDTHTVGFFLSINDANLFAAAPQMLWAIKLLLGEPPTDEMHHELCMLVAEIDGDGEKEA
jgi:hypothetical protein